MCFVKIPSRIPLRARGLEGFALLRRPAATNQLGSALRRSELPSHLELLRLHTRLPRRFRLGSDPDSSHHSTSTSYLTSGYRSDLPRYL